MNTLGGHILLFNTIMRRFTAPKASNSLVKSTEWKAKSSRSSVTKLVFTKKQPSSTSAVSTGPGKRAKLEISSHELAADNGPDNQDTMSPSEEVRPSRPRKQIVRHSIDDRYVNVISDHQ